MELDLSMPLVPFAMAKVWGESARSALARERTTQINSFCFARSLFSGHRGLIVALGAVDISKGHANPGKSPVTGRMHIAKYPNLCARCATQKPGVRSFPSKLLVDQPEFR